MSDKPCTSLNARAAGSRRRSLGFTLVELMIVVLVASILLAVAIPTYKYEIRKSRRTDAKTALMDLAGREERYYNTNNNTYTATALGLGYGTTGNVTNLSVGSGYYTVTVTVTAGSATTLPTYSITATPQGDQVNDTACTSFTVTSTGAQTATPSANSTTCWQ